MENKEQMCIKDRIMSKKNNFGLMNEWICITLIPLSQNPYVKYTFFICIR